MPRTDLLALTAELCAIPSVTGDEDAMADAVVARLDGLDVERRGRAVLAHGPWRRRPLVLLLGHTDTVRPQDDAAVRIEQGPAGPRVVGLGASDMKSGLAVMLALPAELDLGALPYDLGLVFYDAEEGPYAENGLGPLLREVPWLREAALAFCLEPSDNEVQVGCLGALHATVTFKGRAAHSARPWQGENAVHKAAPLLSRLAARSPRDVVQGGLLFREVTSATLAHGGVQRNRVPDAFVVNLNHRFAPDRTLRQAQQDVLDLVAGEGEVEFTDLCPAGRAVTDNPLLQSFLAQTGAPVGPKQAWTDVAQLTEAGIDAVNFGPGHSAQAHQEGEYVDLASVVRGYEMFAAFLRGG